MTVVLLSLVIAGNTAAPVTAALGLNLSLVVIRFSLMWAIAPSYDRSQAQHRWTFWLSPFADPLAVLRILLSSLRTPKRWRGRQYSL